MLMDRSCLAVIVYMRDSRMLVTYNQVPVPVVVPCVLSSVTLPPILEVHSSTMELKNQ